MTINILKNIFKKKKLKKKIKYEKENRNNHFLNQKNQKTQVFDEELLKKLIAEGYKPSTPDIQMNQEINPEDQLSKKKEKKLGKKRKKIEDDKKTLKTGGVGILYSSPKKISPEKLAKTYGEYEDNQNF